MNLRSAPRWLGLVVLLGLMVLITGCGGGPATTKVSGKVTYNDKPLPHGTVAFQSTQQNGPGYSAEVDANGVYTMDKVILGDYKVAVTVPEPPRVPMAGRGGHKIQFGPPKEALPPEAQGSTGAMGGRPQAAADLVKIPTKYADPAESGITVKVTSDKKSYDIPLTGK